MQLKRMFMQLPEKLRGMPRWKKILAVLVLLLLLVAVYQLLVRRGMPPDALPLPGEEIVGLASPQDAAVYLAAREFIEALLRDDREKVLVMLTEGHRANWTDASFLYDGTELREGQHAVLGQFRHSVVRYERLPELGGERVALLTARYTVLFKDGEVVEREFRIEENMVLQYVAETWLVAADERKILE